jgi:hypothetical protein
MRISVLIVVVIAAATCVGAALAKDGVIARLANPTAVQAPAATTVSLVWTLRPDKHAFGASGIYVRLRGRTGTTTVAQASELASGRYRARVRIPAGGVRSMAIGLIGWASNPLRRADHYFPVVNDPTRR